MTIRKRLTKNRVLSALEQSGGIRSDAAVALGSTREGLCNFLSRYPEVLHEVAERILDLVESKLMQLIDRGDGASVRFYLRCKGKPRGWVQGEGAAAPWGVPSDEAVLVLPAPMSVEEWTAKCGKRSTTYDPTESRGIGLLGQKP